MCMQLTPDGQTLAIASRSLMLRLWDWQEHRLVRAFKVSKGEFILLPFLNDSVFLTFLPQAHTGPVASMDFDSTSTLLATGAADATVKVWDIRQGYCTHNFRGSTGVVR